MCRFRLTLSVAFIVAMTFAVFGQQALAQTPYHFKVAAVSSPKAHVDKTVKEKAVLEPLIAGFGVLPPTDGNGFPDWPCLAGSDWTNAADCSSIATGGFVIGEPAYTQSLSACDDNTSTVSPCGQTFWVYQDDTGDNTDDLVVSIVVKQGKNYILDSGSIPLETNPYPAGTVVSISLENAFGTLGQTGPSNGYCAGGTETCVNPVAGAAAVTITTTVGTSTITQKFNMFFE